MPVIKPTGSAMLFLSFLVLFCMGRPAEAQVMSKWGHPVISFGWTPYDVIDQGMGNYPGSPGFIPGYGYYPGPGPGTYPWMDGPGTPFDRRKLMPSAPLHGPVLAEEVTPPRGAALIIVKIPAEAELWFDDVKTSQGGSYRQFTTPPLPSNGNSFYTIRARWEIKGLELTRVESVRVRPDEKQTVNFLTTDSWTGRRISTLPTPRIIEPTN